MRFVTGLEKFLLALIFLLGVVPFALAAMQGDTAEDEPPPPIDFAVVSATKDKTHPDYGKGLDTGFVVNGVQGGTLVLVRGKTYAFDIDTGVMHDFYFSKKAIGYGMATIKDGVKGQFTYKGIVTFTPGPTTPDTIYYACRNHKFMGGEIHVVNPGEEGKFQGVKSKLAK
jgi:hypothetical protein